MLLYIIYIEPLLLMLEKRLKGFPLESPLQLGPSSISFEGAREKSEGFVDDTEAVITNDKELLLVDEILREFEQMSGAIVNRSKKCKIMGLGGWKSRTEWPLDYLKVVPTIKIFGIKMSSTIGNILDDNWAEQFIKFRNTLFSWSSRRLPTIRERVEVLTTFGLSKIWYRSQILPLPAIWASKFEKEI